MHETTSSLWWRDSNQMASGKPGAVRRTALDFSSAPSVPEPSAFGDYRYAIAPQRMTSMLKHSVDTDVQLYIALNRP